MAAYTPPGHGYPHATLHSPSSGGSNDPQLPAHHLPAPSQPYPYDPQSVPSLQSPYGNGHTNGHGDHAHQVIPPPPPAPGSASGGGAQKGNRLRKACDSCSQRKVKCDESGIPCRACAALDIPCTFDRPSRRRGPPNRHAEAIKKRRLESPSGAGTISSPTSPSNVAETLVSFSSNAVLSAESICPLSTLELLVDDFFTYIHPLCPFPHEPSFRVAFKRREDLGNPRFLALLASMVGVLVASFPRKPRLHLKAQNREHLFPNSLSLVESCHSIAVQARGPGYLDHHDLNVYDAVTSYFLGLAGGYTFEWTRTRLYFGEALTIIRVTGVHKVRNLAFIPAAFGGEKNNFQQQENVDYIKQEIGRRVFWVIFVGIRSMQQIGGSFGELLIPPPTKTDPYPPLPMEVDDDYIYEKKVDPQPQGVISKLTGFNLNCQIYQTVTPLATMELAYGIDSVFDINKQKKVMEECLRSVKRVLDKAPPELMLHVGSQAGEFGKPTRQYYPPMPDYLGLRSNGNEPGQNIQENWETRRQLQCEIQKANIYASQLGTRSYIVEKYWTLEAAYKEMNASSAEIFPLSSPGLIASGLDGMLSKQSGPSQYDGIEINITEERESVVKDLLWMLGSISQINMEPNGSSFINKIRQIASTLVGTPENLKGSSKREEYLQRFLQILMKLERTSPGPRGDHRTPAEVEEEELQNWADLRENQRRFMEAGGFLSEI